MLINEIKSHILEQVTPPPTLKNKNKKKGYNYIDYYQGRHWVSGGGHGNPFA